VKMLLTQKFRIFALISALIDSVLLVFIQDTFLKCYDVTVQPHYQTVGFDWHSECALVCLSDNHCAGFDKCNRNGQICRLRNESSVASCSVKYRPGNNTDGCDSYRRVSILWKNKYII
jgi:hypothetical protein